MDFVYEGVFCRAYTPRMFGMYDCNHRARDIFARTLPRAQGTSISGQRKCLNLGWTLVREPIV